MLPIWGEPDWVDALALVSILIMPVIVGYGLMLWSRSAVTQRIGALIVAVIAGFVGTVWMMAYAIPALDDFHRVNLSDALVGNLFHLVNLPRSARY